jgi:peptidoglycan hydrolase-like protein with peptidoglycan-binding domain
MALAVVAAGVLIGRGGGSGAVAAAAAGGYSGKVERRTLAERLTADGTIGYAGETTVLARLAGTVTELPAVGTVVHRGQLLYAIDGKPVLLFYGSVPAYRTLAEGVGAGEDVEGLERNLAALGFDPGTVDEHFTSNTAAAVRGWQEALGIAATGEVELGRVAFLPGPRRVTGLEAELGEGLAGAGREPVLRTSSTRRIVSVELEPDQGRVAHRGQKVRVVLPNGAEVPGVVRRLAAVQAAAVEDGTGEESEPGVEATVAVLGGHRIPAIDGASANVLFTERIRRGVLSVPLTALVAIGGGRFAVDAREGAGGRQIVVTPGLAADGYVEIKGQGLRPGMTVQAGR